MNCISTRRFLLSLLTIFLCSAGASLSGNEEGDFPRVIPVEEEISTNLIDYFAESIGGNLDDAYLYRIHNDAYYHLVTYTDDGDTVQLQDASRWAVHGSQRNIVLYWVQSDDIFIKPKSSCFSSHHFVLHNRTLNQAVEVNLVSPPLPLGAATLRILNIEPFQRLVHLSDNTVWQIDAQDTNFPYWQRGQRLMVGVDNEWRTAPLPHILINVDMRKEPYSSANFYGYGVVN